MTNTRLHNIWKGIKTRCLNPNAPAFKDYGGRGITICDEWLEFSNFNRDMAETYADNLTIERINNDLGYSAENCRWIPKADQMANTTKTVLVATPQGEIHLAKAAKIYGVDYSTLYARHKRGLTGDDLFAPLSNSRG